MSAPLVSFEPVVPSDFEALAALRIAAMRPSLERIGRYDPVRARGRLMASFSPPHTRHIVVDGKRVGFVVIKPRNDGLLLDHLYIQPGAQGAGVGTAVLAQLFADADAAGQDLHVGALRDSDANRFYTRHGFQELKREEFDNYYVRRAGSGKAHEG
jgi:ribosomal protein S18 acetylase RimI-like enzyme